MNNKLTREELLMEVILHLLSHINSERDTNFIIDLNNKVNSKLVIQQQDNIVTLTAL